ncbi:hypothetical protein JCM11251_005611 [Rhodosporidiobolus azoricus]
MSLPDYQRAQLHDAFGLLRQAFGRARHSSVASRAQGYVARMPHQALESEWEKQIEAACDRNVHRWTLANFDAILRFVEDQATDVARGRITDVFQLLLHSNAPPFIPSHVSAPPPVVHHHEPQHGVLVPHNLPPIPPPAIQLFNAAYPLQQTCGPTAPSISAHAGGHQFMHHHPTAPALAAPAAAPADDVSYHIDIFPLLTRINGAFHGYVGVYYTEEEQPEQLDIEADWDEEVREYVRENWRRWGDSHGGLARTQARELLQQTLQHIQNDTLKVLPPIGLFMMLPRLNGRFAEEEELHDPPGNATSDTHTYHTGQNAWTSGQYYGLQGYARTLRTWLDENQHRVPEPASGHPHERHSMHELARWHRRMTPRQMMRYGPAGRAFAVSM